MSSYVIVACQAVIAVTFAASTVGKLRGLAEFRRTLAGLRVPRRLLGAVVWVVVVAEAVTVFAVVMFAQVGFIVAVLLLAVFTVVIAFMVRRRVRVPCRCFGAGNDPPGAAHLARNTVLILVAAAGAGLALSGSGPHAGVAASVLAAMAGLTIALVLINLEDIVAVVGPAR